MKIQFVTAIHGNEPLPTLALSSIGERQVVANPRALSRGVRYVERDMNASFGVGGESYEEKRAREVLGEIDKDTTVLDLHTFSCDSPPFAVVVDIEMLQLASSLGIDRVVYMKHNVKVGRAFINHRRGVSVEMGRHDDPAAFDRTIDLVKRIRGGDLNPGSVRVYEVFGRIEGKGDYENFKLHKDGFVPVLYGERAYPESGFFGLKAREITDTIGGNI